MTNPYKLKERYFIAALNYLLSKYNISQESFYFLSDEKVTNPFYIFYKDNDEERPFRIMSKVELPEMIRLQVIEVYKSSLANPQT
jgi:hypothetical protein